MNLYVVVAKHRSGHHAVLNWICAQHGNIRHINDVHLSDDKTQFKTPQKEAGLTVYGSGRDTLINLEGFKLGLWRKDAWEDTPAVKSYDRIYPVLVVRRFRNWLASTVVTIESKKPETRALHGYLDKRILCYRDHINAAVTKRSPFSNLLVILYDKWVKSAEYRESLCKPLDIPFTDDGLQSVPKFGSGSSFNAREYDSKAQEMNVLNRWKQVASNTTFKLYRDKYKDLDMLSEYYFSSHGVGTIVPVSKRD